MGDLLGSRQPRAYKYPRQTCPPHGVDITSTIRTDTGREVFKAAEERSSDELGGSRGGYGYTTRLPLKGLSPGLYVLTVEGRSRLGNSDAVSRVVQFRIR